VRIFFNESTRSKSPNARSVNIGFGSMINEVTSASVST